MSTSFIEETSHTRIDLNNWLLDTQNELQGKIQQLIKNYGKDSADRRHRDGYYSGKLSQFNDLWQPFFDLDEEVQQATLLTGSEYSSRVLALKEQVGKYQNFFLDNTPTGSGLPKAPRRTSANTEITTRDQVKGDPAIDTVIRQLQRRCNELESSLTLASNALTGVRMFVPKGAQHEHTQQIWSNQVGNSPRRSVPPTAYGNCWSTYYMSHWITVSPTQPVIYLKSIFSGHYFLTDGCLNLLQTSP